MKVLGEKVGKLAIDELAVAGLTKVVSEKILSKTPVGNATYMSGAVKLGLALALNYFSDNKYLRSASVGIGVDGIEDIATRLLGGFVANGEDMVI